MELEQKNPLPIRDRSPIVLPIVGHYTKLPSSIPQNVFGKIMKQNAPLHYLEQSVKEEQCTMYQSNNNEEDE